MSINEAAEYTRLSVHTLYNWISLRKVPFIKAGGKILFSREALDDWLGARAVKTVKEFVDSGV